MGVAGGSPGSGQKMGRNYPCLLSRNDVEKWQYGVAPEV